MSFEKAKDYLKKYNLDNRIKIFKGSSATVKEAALEIGCKEKEIAKSLSFIVNEKPILIIVSGDKKVDNAKFKKEFNTKAKMISYEKVNELIGHEVGGVCPFGIKKDVQIYFDKSLQELDTLYPACGSTNSAVELKRTELEKIIPIEKWIDICKEEI